VVARQGCCVSYFDRIIECSKYEHVMDSNTLELGVLMNFVVIQLGGDGVL
jgi:hypothetical protein